MEGLFFNEFWRTLFLQTADDPFDTDLNRLHRPPSHPISPDRDGLGGLHRPYLLTVPFTKGGQVKLPKTKTTGL